MAGFTKSFTPYPDAMLTATDLTERARLRELALDHKEQFPKHARLVVGGNFVECMNCGYHVHIDAGREIEHI